MKHITITGKDLLGNKILYPDQDGTINKIEFTEAIEASDGYHTFDELYEHRIRLFIALCKQLAANSTLKVWRSKKHADDTMFEDWFIMGIHSTPGEIITYHLPLSVWEATNFAYTLKKAYEWDGHTAEDVLERIKKL